jgi:radical SAM protein with 4Fe4S-binding SPASM domain
VKKSISQPIELVRTVTPSRLINSAKVMAGYWWSRFTGHTFHPGLPMSIAVEPTTSCNLRCPECPSGLRSFTRPTGMLDPALFEKIVRETNRHVQYLTFYFQGEPFLHPHFLDLVKIARKYNLYTITSTNGHFLDEETAIKTIESGLNKLIISVDGATQDTYQQYRIGGSLEKVVQGASRIIAAKRKLNSGLPRVVLQMLVVRPNEHERNSVIQLGKEIGVDETVFKTAQVYDFENGHSLIPEDSRYARYTKQADGKWKIKNNLDDHCWKMWHSCVITWDGKVVPCCFDKDAKHVMGDLHQQSMREVWNSSAYRQFREQLFKGRKEMEICKNCTEGMTIFE